MTADDDKEHQYLELLRTFLAWGRSAQELVAACSDLGDETLRRPVLALVSRDARAWLVGMRSLPPAEIPAELRLAYAECIAGLEVLATIETDLSLIRAAAERLGRALTLSETLGLRRRQ